MEVWLPGSNWGSGRRLGQSKHGGVSVFSRGRPRSSADLQGNQTETRNPCWSSNKKHTHTGKKEKNRKPGEAGFPPNQRKTNEPRQVLGPFAVGTLRGGSGERFRAEVLMPLATVVQLVVAYTLGLFFFQEQAEWFSNATPKLPFAEDLFFTCCF